HHTYEYAIGHDRDYTSCSDTSTPASLQGHRPRTLDDLPARSRTTIPDPSAHRFARRGLGGIGSAALAGEAHRAPSARRDLNRTDAVAHQGPLITVRHRWRARR